MIKKDGKKLTLPGFFIIQSLFSPLNMHIFYLPISLPSLMILIVMNGRWLCVIKVGKMLM